MLWLNSHYWIELNHFSHSLISYFHFRTRKLLEMKVNVLLTTEHIKFCWRMQNRSLTLLSAFITCGCIILTVRMRKSLRSLPVCWRKRRWLGRWWLRPRRFLRRRSWMQKQLWPSWWNFLKVTNVFVLNASDDETSILLAFLFINLRILWF